MRSGLRTIPYNSYACLNNILNAVRVLTEEDFSTAVLVFGIFRGVCRRLGLDIAVYMIRQEDIASGLALLRGLAQAGQGGVVLV